MTTVKELEDALKTHFSENPVSNRGDIYHELGDELKWGSARKDGLELPNIGTLNLVESFGGEGQGDQYWLIFSLGDQLFKLDGWYASFDGGYYERILEVEAKEVTKTVYTTVK